MHGGGVRVKQRGPKRKTHKQAGNRTTGKLYQIAVCQSPQNNIQTKQAKCKPEIKREIKNQKPGAHGRVFTNTEDEHLNTQGLINY